MSCAIMDALSAHETMNKRAVDSERVRAGLKDILLACEALRVAAGTAQIVVQPYGFFGVLYSPSF